jgi:hypothetical protein
MSYFCTCCHILRTWTQLKNHLVLVSVLVSWSCYNWSITGKAYLRRNSALIRAADEPIFALLDSVGCIQPKMAEAWFKHAGYVVSEEWLRYNCIMVWKYNNGTTKRGQWRAANPLTVQKQNDKTTKREWQRATKGSVPHTYTSITKKVAMFLKHPNPRQFRKPSFPMPIFSIQLVYWVSWRILQLFQSLTINRRDIIMQTELVQCDQVMTSFQWGWRSRRDWWLQWCLNRSRHNCYTGKLMLRKLILLLLLLLDHIGHHKFEKRWCGRRWSCWCSRYSRNLDNATIFLSLCWWNGSLLWLYAGLVVKMRWRWWNVKSCCFACLWKVWVSSLTALKQDTQYEMPKCWDRCRWVPSLRIGIDSFAGEQRVIITGIFLFELLPSRPHHIKGYLIAKQSAKIRERSNCLPVVAQYDHELWVSQALYSQIPAQERLLFH